MKKRVANKWIKALKSGEYKQTTGHMTVTDFMGTSSFCCLGVLTNLYVEENGLKGFTVDEKDDWIKRDGVNDEGEGKLNNAVIKWSGMKSSTGRLGKGSLSDMNDSGISFNFIANLIKDNVEKL